VTGCGCLVLIVVLVGGILFMIFGSTDPGESVAQATVLAETLLLLLWMTLVPLGRRLVGARRA
jgi:hypothetical protein